MRCTLLIYTSLLFVPLSVEWAFDESDLKKLQTLNECNKCDLSRIDLSYADLFKANLTGADLTGANLLGANLKHADFTGADLTGVTLSSTLKFETIFCKAKMPTGKTGKCE